jgi:hypothetical protein
MLLHNGIHNRRIFLADPRLIARGRFVYRDGSPDAMIGIVADIDERKRTEAALVETAHLRNAQDRRAIQVLQEALIRPDFPALAHFDLAARYLPADSDTELGGDWYDAFTLPDGRIMIGVGDVSGHGIRAARLMAKLRQSTRAYACIDPTRPMSCANSTDSFSTSASGTSSPPSNSRFLIRSAARTNSCPQATLLPSISMGNTPRSSTETRRR